MMSCLLFASYNGITRSDQNAQVRAGDKEREIPRQSYSYELCRSWCAFKHRQKEEMFAFERNYFVNCSAQQLGNVKNVASQELNANNMHE